MNVQSPCITVIEDDIQRQNDQTLPHLSTDSTLTSISSCSHKNNEVEFVSSSLKIRIKRSLSLSSSKSNRIIPVFKSFKQRIVKSSLSGHRLTKPNDRSMTVDKLKKSIMKTTRTRQAHESHCFRWFFQHIFCRFVPLNPNSSVAVEANPQFTNDSNDNSTMDTKIMTTVNSSLQVKSTDFKSLTKFENKNILIKLNQNMLIISYD